MLHSLLPLPSSAPRHMLFNLSYRQRRGGLELNVSHPGRQRSRPGRAGTLTVIGKIANCRTVLLRAIRDHAENTQVTALDAEAGRLARQLKDLRRALALDTVRGLVPLGDPPALP
jgi:hypothetical protein